MNVCIFYQVQHNWIDSKHGQLPVMVRFGRPRLIWKNVWVEEGTKSPSTGMSWDVGTFALHFPNRTPLLFFFHTGLCIYIHSTISSSELWTVPKIMLDRCTVLRECTDVQWVGSWQLPRPRGIGNWGRGGIWIKNSTLPPPLHATTTAA